VATTAQREAEVGGAEIADAADVSVATVLKHFPSKEALLFDQDADREAALIARYATASPGRRSSTLCATCSSRPARVRPTLTCSGFRRSSRARRACGST
jgi:AcrR family transcriptional regulator